MLLVIVSRGMVNALCCLVLGTTVTPVADFISFFEEPLDESHHVRSIYSRHVGQSLHGVYCHV